MEIVATFGGITTLAKTILSLADKWYNVTEEHKSNVDAVQHKLEFFTQLTSKHGAPVDNRKMKKLKEAETLLKNEEDNLKLLDDRIQSAQYCGVIWWWSVYAKIAMIELPEQLEKNITKATKAVDEVLAELKWEQETATSVTKWGEQKPVDDSTILDNDNLYVAIEETQKDVIGAIEDSTGRSIILLHGGFGKGKSTLARKMCEYFGKSGSKQNMFEHVILVPCGNGDVTSFTKQREILQRLSPGSVNESIKENKSEDRNSTARIAEALRNFFSDKKILVILDDVPGSESGKSFLMEMWKAILGGSQHVKFLVTSQESELCDSLDNSSKKIGMKDPTEAEAMKILASHLGWQDKIIPETFQDDAEEIVKTVDGHPLTLVWVAKSIGDRNALDDWGDALYRLDNLLKDTHSIKRVLGEKYANPPAVAMWRSIESLRTDARFILVLIYACRVEVPEDVLKILYSTVETSTSFSSALGELRNKDLLNPNSSTLAPKTNSGGKAKLSLRSLVKHCCMALGMGESGNSEIKPVRDWKEFRSFMSALLGENETGEQSSEKRVAITLCSLYFDGKHQDEFVRTLATQGHLTDSNEGNIDLRRTAIEQIVSLLVKRYKDEHRDEHINYARQVFLKYICKQKLDDDSICALLTVASSDTAPLATLAAIADILEIEEAPLLNQGRPRFLEVIVHLLESSISSVSLQKKGKAVLEAEQRGKQRDQLCFHERASKAIAYVSWKAAQENVLSKVAETPGILTVLVHSVQHTLAHSGTAKDDDPEYSAWALALLARGGNSVKSQIVDEEDALPTLVLSLSQESHPKLQYHAAGALVTLVAGQDWIKAKVLEEDQALPLLLKYLSQENNQRLQVYATLALGRLARGPESIKSKILEQDQVFAPALPLLLKSLSQDNNPALQREAAWALGELVHGHDSIKAKLLEEDQALPLLVKSLSQDNNPDLQGNAAWALSGLAEGQDSIKTKVLEESGALSSLVKALAQDSNPNLQECAVLALGTLAKGLDSIKSKIVEEGGALSGLVKALAQDNNPNLQESAGGH